MDSNELKEVSIDGCPLIGDGFNGSVYRLDDETIVKVYKNSDSLGMIKREQMLARKAFVMGIPTAIPFGIVKVGEQYGAVFELLNPRPVNSLIVDDESIKEFCKKSVNLLKTIHSTTVDVGDFPSRREQIIEQAIACKPILGEQNFNKVNKLIATIPEGNTLLHSDFHIKNIMEQNDELLLIDMDTLSRGHIIFEFSAMYATYVAFGQINKDNSMKFLEIPNETSHKIWKLTFDDYFSNVSEKEKDSMLEKISVLSFLEVLYFRSVFGDQSQELMRQEVQYAADYVIKKVIELQTLNF